jgi:DNA-binding transcriptional regulator PaaX
MNLSDYLLKILFSYSGGYKLLRRRLYAPTLPDFGARRRIAEATLRTTLSRLKKRGLVQNKNAVWSITEQGKKYLETKLATLLLPHPIYTESLKKREKNMIIAFDIPEKYRKKRDWLRIELINLGFSPIQKSVWLGPAPLPQEFIKSLEELKLLPFLKFFQAKEIDIV